MLAAGLVPAPEAGTSIAIGCEKPKHCRRWALRSAFLCALCGFLCDLCGKALNRKDRQEMPPRPQMKSRRLCLCFLPGWGSLACFRGLPARQKRRPAQLAGRILIAKRFGHSHFRDRIHDPVKIRLAHGMNVGVRRRIEKINGVRNAIFDRELNRVEVVTQRAGTASANLSPPGRAAWDRQVQDFSHSAREKAPWDRSA